MALGLLWVWLSSFCGCGRPVAPVIPEVPQVDTYPEVRVALEQARDWVREHPDSGPAWGRLGMHFAAHEFSSEAELCYQQARTLDATAARWPYLLGVLIETTDPAESAQCYQQAIERLPRELAPRLRAAELQLSRGLVTQAQQALESLQREYPREARIVYRLAQARQLQGDLATALTLNTTAVELLPTHRAVRELQAQLLFASGQAEAAARELTVLRELPGLQTGWPDPWLEEVRACRHDPHRTATEAYWLSESGNLAEAEHRLRDLVTRYPEEWLFAAQWARCQLALGQSSAAVESLTAAIRRQHNVADLYRLRGSAYLILAEWPLAEHDYAQANLLKPDDAATWSDRAYVQEQTGDLQAAVESLQQAIRLEPGRIADRVRLVKLLQRMERWDSAAAELQSLITRDPEHSERQRLEQSFPK